MPIKLFDYLSYGRPLLVTDCVEQARVVADGDAGVVTADDPAAMATAITAILRAPGEQRVRWAANAHRLAGEASWGERAARIVAVLGET
jgi:glycosyltransferase involved in cell wall biosynthesis